MGDLHKILQVRPGADDETIAAAYARLRRRYDPAHGGPFADEAALHELERAYAVLSDPEARDAYEMAGGRQQGLLSDDGRVPPETPRPTFPTPAARDPFGLESQDPPASRAPVSQPALDSTAVDRRPEPTSTSADLWRAADPALQPASTPTPISDEQATTKVAHSLGDLPLREKTQTPVASPGWLPDWSRGRVLPAASALLVLVGGGLAIWGVLQAVDEADDGEGATGSEATPAAEATSGEQGGEAPETLAAPVVASADALPADLREFAEDVVADFEADDGTRYRIYDFVATVTSDDSVFYAAMVIQAESDLVGQSVFFFLDESFLGRDWGEDVRSVESINSATGGEIGVVYRLYADGDEDCCPSGEPFAVVYSYEGEFRADSASPPDGIFVE